MGRQAQPIDSKVDIAAVQGKMPSSKLLILTRAQKAHDPTRVAQESRARTATKVHARLTTVGSGSSLTAILLITCWSAAGLKIAYYTA